MSEQGRKFTCATVQCEGKERFGSPGLANEVVKRRNRMKKARKLDDRHLVSYRCFHCGGWHIGGKVR